MVERQKEAKLRLLEKDERKMELMNEKIIEFLESDDFEVNADNFTFIIKSYEKIKENYSKIMGFLTSYGENKKSLTFNINVPVKYLNREGRAWMKRQLENPFTADSIEDIDFEVVDNEEAMQRANQKKIEEMRNRK